MYKTYNISKSRTCKGIVAYGYS